MNKYQKIIAKKWFYFSLGAFFALLLSGGAIYIAQNVKGESFIKSTQTADDNYPAFRADGRGHIWGGLTTNQLKAPSGLIVLGGYDPNPPINGLYGKVGIGFPGDTQEIPSEMLEVRGKIKIVDRIDTSEVESLLAPAVSVTDVYTKNITANQGGKIYIKGDTDLEGELSIIGNRGKSTSTVDSTLLVRTGDGAYVDIGDVFYITSGTKVWKDGTTPFNWISGSTYDDSRQNISSSCSGGVGTAGLTGYQVTVIDGKDKWVRVVCQDFPYPPPAEGCVYTRSMDIRLGLLDKLKQTVGDWFIRAAEAAVCHDWRWVQDSTQPSGLPIIAWNPEASLKIKSQYLP